MVAGCLLSVVSLYIPAPALQAKAARVKDARTNVLVGATRVRAAPCHLNWSIEARPRFNAEDIAVRGRRVVVVGWRGTTVGHGLILERDDRGKWIMRAPAGRMKLKTVSSDGAWIGGSKHGQALVMHRIDSHWAAVPSVGLGNSIDDIDANGSDVWVATNDGHGGALFGLRVGRWSGIPFPGPLSIAAVGKGALWVGGSDGIAYWTGERWIHQVRGFDVFALAANSPSRALGLDWDGNAIHSLHWDGRRGTKVYFGSPQTGGANYPQAVLLHGPGGIWAAATSQLARWRNGKWNTVALPGRFASYGISAMAGTPSALWLTLNGTLNAGVVVRGVCEGAG